MKWVFVNFLLVDSSNLIDKQYRCLFVWWVEILISSRMLVNGVLSKHVACSERVYGQQGGGTDVCEPCCVTS